MRFLWVNFAAVYCLFGFSNAVFKLLATSEEGNLASWFSVYFVTVIVIAVISIMSKWRQVIFLLSKNKTLLFVLLYMLLSSCWALSAGLGFVTAVRYSIAALFGLYLAARYSEKDLMALIAITLAAIVAGSLFISALLPEYGRIHDGGPNDGAWQGAFTSRNGFSIFMNIAFFVFMTSARTFCNLRYICYIFAAISFVLVILSGSATGLLMFIIIASLPLWLPLMRRHGILVLSFAISLICFAGLLFALTGIKPDAEFFLKALGKDPTLSGRNETWSSVSRIMAENGAGRLLFGYGPAELNVTTGGQIVTEAYAKEAESIYPSENSRRAAWPIDNGYINISLKFGVIGFLLFAMCIFKALSIVMHYIKNEPTKLQNFYIVIMLILLINGITESVDRQTLLWIFFTILLARPYIHKAQYA